MRLQEGILASALGVLIAVTPLRAAETIQHFPANQPAAERETQWRVVWGVDRHGGQSEVLFVKEAYFQRNKNERELKIVGDCRLAEIFVPYNDGLRIYDISGHSFELVDVNDSVLGPACVTPGIILDRAGNKATTGVVAKEVHDGHLRWMNAAEKSRRGQSLSLWSVLDGANYRYVMLYEFRDDGQISVRLGATAHNLNSSDDDSTTHLHLGCWRIHLAIGHSTQTKAAVVRLDTEHGTTVVEPLEQESRIKWSADEFTGLRIESLVEKNKHIPPHPVSYDLLSTRMGSGRFNGVGEEFTVHDLWLTRDNPAELRPRDLAQHENGETLTGADIAIWHHVSILHRARDEDFGTEGTDNWSGVAITTWGGFELKPRNLFPSTPLYEP